MNLATGSSDFEKEQYEALKAAYRLFGHDDLMKFWLFENHRCIYKWAHYFPIYEKWFAPYRGKEIVFVEIGVQNGGSIQMLRNYFGGKAKIVGVDIIPVCKQLEDTEQNIFVEIGSQDDPNFWAAFKEKYPRVDILLDDGGHEMNQQLVTFREMFPHIKDGGLYMCEDCHTSYQAKYNGGLKREGTFIEFTKNLIDELNAFHTEGTLPPTYNTLNMGGICFYDSIVVVEKKKVPFKPFDLPVGDFAEVF
ncbi:MAG: class I SAM-dependent methyltransferase [Selenomonadaceae bacterium]|nr:class I SAM-dependent methyltransferase [Selenomonadaceae bacterium]MBR4383368.1 class I SAM-dependent methyltransferase [Selenomonadaceae bacterium]